jgi:micrococcal nuclease
MKGLAFRNGQGRSVTLKTDPTQDLTDRYGRLLAYVSASGSDFGRTMISSGWAKTYVYKVRFQRVNAYRSAEKSAGSARRGVHRRCAGNFHRTA